MIPTAVTTTTGPASAAPSGSTGRRNFVVVIAALIVGLIAPLFLNTAIASARRTSAEMSIANSVLSTINHERAVHHLRPVSMNYHLIVSARGHNLAMARKQTMSHQLPGEARFSSRMTSAGYHWTWAGENIGWHSVMTASAANQLETMMYNEKAPNDGHRRNILNSHFTNVGVDIYLDQAHHKMWLTTDYGRP